MQDRLENVAADFGDVDMFQVGEAEQCRERLQEFAGRLAIAIDPTPGSASRRAPRSGTPVHNFTRRRKAVRGDLL
jgi:hypothetical protein